MIGIIMNYKDARLHYFEIKDESEVESEVIEKADELELTEQDYYWMSAPCLDLRCENE